MRRWIGVWGLGIGWDPYSKGKKPGSCTGALLYVEGAALGTLVRERTHRAALWLSPNRGATYAVGARWQCNLDRNRFARRGDLDAVSSAMLGAI